MVGVCSKTVCKQHDSWAAITSYALFNTPWLLINKKQGGIFLGDERARSTRLRVALILDSKNARPKLKFTGQAIFHVRSKFETAMPLLLPLWMI